MPEGSNTNTRGAESGVSSASRKREVWNAMPKEAQENISALIREFYGDDKPKSIQLRVGNLEYRKRG